MFSQFARRAFQAPLGSLEYDMLQRQVEPQPVGASPPQFLVGLSVGQGSQPTGIAILRKDKPGSEAPATYVCRYLHRWLPPATTYPAVFAALKSMHGRPELAECHLLVEAG